MNNTTTETRVPQCSVSEQDNRTTSIITEGRAGGSVQQELLNYQSQYRDMHPPYDRKWLNGVSNNYLQSQFRTWEQVETNACVEREVICDGELTSLTPKGEIRVHPHVLVRGGTIFVDDVPYFIPDGINEFVRVSSIAEFRSCLILAVTTSQGPLMLWVREYTAETLLPIFVESYCAGSGWGKFETHSDGAKRFLLSETQGEEPDWDALSLGHWSMVPGVIYHAFEGRVIYSPEHEVLQNLG